jgi:hypothetical protein
MSDAVLVAFLTGVFGPVIVLIVKHLIDKKKDPFVSAVNESNIVCNELDRLLIEYSADRIWIAQFHNGGVYYPTGKSIQKFSIFFEVTKNVKDAIKMTFQNIPVNLFSKFLGKVLHDDFISIPDYKDDAVETYGLKYVAEEHSSKSSYLFSIRTMDDRLIGIMAVEYTSKKKQLTEKETIELRLEATKIGGVLGNKK